MVRSFDRFKMRFIKYQQADSYKIILLTFTLAVYLKSVATHKMSELNKINTNDDTVFNWDEADGIRYFDTENRNSEILSRKRRYLTFPSGSSFQLVYDLIIGVVDFTNYLILGITSALAWQLPSEAPSEILTTLNDRLNDGTLGTSRNDTIENIQYVDTKPKPPQKPSYITSNTNPSYSKLQPTYYTANQFHPPMDTKYFSSKPVYYTQSNNVLSRKHDMDYYTTRLNPLMEWKDSKIRKVSPSVPKSPSTFASKLSQWWNNKPKQTYRKPQYSRKHRIFPVFAKRNVHNRKKRHGIEGPSLTKIDSIHLRYHRSSRQHLYNKIEKYLETHKKNGHECVLKALCETGQKSNEVEPGTFVGEIMRSIFTIPESEDPVQNYKHQIYDTAHAHDGNCMEKYPLCSDSVWTADFVL